MKKIVVLIIVFVLNFLAVCAKTDKMSADYLKNKKHFAIMNPLAENIAEKAIKKSLKKQTDSDFDINFQGYTFLSMKAGIFKSLDIKGQDVIIETIKIPYIRIKTLTDYNWIDYKQKPPVIKTAMTYAYEIHLSEESINQALTNRKYQKTLEKVNNIAYPFFKLNNVETKLKDNKFYMILGYNFPLAPSKKDKNFIISSKFKIINHRIKADDIGINSAYGNIEMSKVANLINLLDPLSFTLSILDTKKCNGQIENIKIIDNIIQINGKIYTKELEKTNEQNITET